MTEHRESPDTIIPGLSLYHTEQPTEPATGMYEPSICMVVQGAKQIFLGEEKIVYDESNYLLTSLHLPTTFQVYQASKEKPYLGLRLLLDLKEVAQMMAGSDLPPPREQQSHLGMSVGETTVPIINAVRRLVQLLQDEADIPIMAPIIQKEIIYRLLSSDQGMKLRQIASSGSQSNQVSKAIIWLKDHFADPINVDELARVVGMSKSTFHQHFRAMTNYSPLQYQKQLRLQEARRLMLMEHKDAASAAFEVGYESPSQFSREYSRQFGAPPLRDISTLRQLAAS
ncbi:MAG: AraC family transcriptional regulator N-terminal domain-containing protein [Puniceicoccales bacterium]